VALAAGMTDAQVAERTGCGSRTIRTWRSKNPAFLPRVAQLRAELTSRALGRLADGMADAAATLRNLLKAKSEQVRLGASRAILELSVRLRESVEMEERLRALENRR
jgi:hypothetical protein